MIKILINSRPAMRYDTLGDWFRVGETDCVEVLGFDDWRYEALIAVHELVEMLVCRQQGVTQEQVDAYDFAFKGAGEPGCQKDAPYYDAHQFACYIEDALCRKLEVDPLTYYLETEKAAIPVRKKA